MSAEIFKPNTLSRLLEPSEPLFPTKPLMETLAPQEVRPFTMEQAIENVKNFSLKTYLMERTPLGLRERLKEREKNGLPPLYSIVAGIDIHKDSIVCCVLGYGHSDGYEIRTFGTFKKDIKEMVDWLVQLKVEQIAGRKYQKKFIFRQFRHEYC
jgi:hypothetical protein